MTWRNAKSGGAEMTPDMKARRVLMAAWLYYEKSVSVVSDEEFDRMCRDVAEELEWHDVIGECDIAPIRVTQLGTAEQLRASAFHVLLTHATIGAAMSWYAEENPDVTPLSDLKGSVGWRTDTTHGCRLRPLLS